MIRQFEEGVSEDKLYTFTIPAVRKGRVLFIIFTAAFAAFYSLLLSSAIPSAGLKNISLAGMSFEGLTQAFNHVLLLLFGTTIFLIALIGLTLWAVFAKEVLKISNPEIQLSKTLFGIGHTYHLNPDDVSSVAYIPSTKNIHKEAQEQTFKERSFHEGKIAITCNGRKYAFARSVEDREAALLAEKIDQLIRSKQNRATPSQIQ